MSAKTLSLQAHRSTKDHNEKARTMNAPLQDVSALPIDAIDVSDATLYQQDSWRSYFARLRAEDPMHWSENDRFGGFWSVTRFEDITAVDGNHEAFS